jgi:hypothetical protein
MPDTPPTLPNWISASHAGRILECTHPTVLKLVREGRLTCRRLGKSRAKVSTADVLRLAFESVSPAINA